MSEDPRHSGPTLGTLGWGCIGAALAACLIGQPALTEWLERKNEAAGLRLAANVGRAAATPLLATDVITADPIASSLPGSWGAPPLQEDEPPSSSSSSFTLPPLHLSSGKSSKPGISVTSNHNVSYSDIAVAIVTSSATIDQRIPILQEAWMGTAPFPVLILTDDGGNTTTFNASSLGDAATVFTTSCSPTLHGLVCKTRLAFEKLAESYPGKKWYLRLMDDTLVIPANLLHVLRKLDPNQPWAVGDKIPIDNGNFSYFQGGGGWGVSGPALETIKDNWHVWDRIILSGGDSPIAPGFTSLAAYSDDLLWGIFMANLAIPSIALEGWSGAPVDMLGGIMPCDAEIKKTFCFRQTFPVGRWPDGKEVTVAGMCRVNMTRVAVVHMGLEIWGGKDPWFEQMVDLSRVLSAHPKDLVATFEDAPLFYWRLCSKAGKTYRVKSVEETYAEIYEQTMAKHRLQQTFDAGTHEQHLYIGLCQEPSDVIALLPEPYQRDPKVGVVLLNALDRLRDRLRHHTRPWVFNLVAGTNRSMQMVYRIGEDAYKIARTTCEAINMTGEPSCIQYAVNQMQSKLPPQMRYDRLCLRKQLHKVDSSQYLIKEITPSVPASTTIAATTPAGVAITNKTRSSSSSVPKLTSYSFMPVASLVEQSHQEFRTKHGWHSFPLSASDIVITVITTSTHLATRLPVLLRSWVKASPFDVVIISDPPAPTPGSWKRRAAALDPRIVHVDCPATTDGMVCKTAAAMDHVWKKYYPHKKWYIRVTDTAVVVPENLLYHLRYVDPSSSWCIGDEMEVIGGMELKYLHGGVGWAMTQSALKAVMPHLDTYRSLPKNGGRDRGLDLEPLHQNLDDFYFGVILNMARVPIKQAEGWTAAPVDALTTEQSCTKLLRSSLVSRQAFHVGKNSRGVVVTGQTPPHVTLYRPAVMNAARVAESYAEDSQWLTSPSHSALLSALSSSDPTTLAAGFDDNPYYYWRLCTMESDAAPQPVIDREIIEEVVRNAGHPEVKEHFVLSGRPVTVPVHVCQDYYRVADPLCQRYSLGDEECKLLGLFVESKRDELRRRFPPFRLTLGLPGGNVPVDYRLGDDPITTAEIACQALNGSSSSPSSSSSDVEDCISMAPVMINQAVSATLRYDKLCKEYMASSSSSSASLPPKKKAIKGTADRTKPATDSKATTAIKDRQKEEEGQERKVPQQQQQQQQQQQPPQRERGYESNEEGASVVHAEAPIDEEEEEARERLLGYLRAGGLSLSVGHPLSGSVIAPGHIPVALAISILSYSDMPVDQVVGVDTDRIQLLLPKTIEKCVSLDGALVRCLHANQFVYNLWVDTPGVHTVSYWASEMLSGNGDMLRESAGVMQFTVTPTAQQTEHPFSRWCSVPFTQRDLLTGRLQRLVEDEGRLNFDYEVAAPLEVFFRLSPRRDAPLHGLSTVTASTMSLIRNLRELSPAQRAVTTLRVYLNGFSSTVDEQWRRWLKKVCDPLSLASLVLERDCPRGNMASFQHMKSHVLGLQDERAIVFLLEDDYLLQPTAIDEMVEVFESHNPCVVIPYDGGERYTFRTYNEDDGKITLIAGRRRHWRTTRSTTVTYAARVGTLKYMDTLGLFMHPDDDYFNSGKLADAGASIVLPLPGLGGHVESQDFYKEPFMPLYFDYIQYSKELRLQAEREGLRLSITNTTT